MTVTTEQWEAVAADLGTTVDGVQARIATIDDQDKVGAAIERAYDMWHLYFDHDLDPISLGTWAVLFEAHSYRLVAETMLPNRYWVATIWTGTNDEIADPPVVFESSASYLAPDRERGLLPAPAVQVTHVGLAAARAAHQGLASHAATFHLEGLRT